MSDEYMILTIERMQIELRRALEDIQLLTEELQRRGPVTLAAPVQEVSADLPLVPLVPIAPEVPSKKKRIFKVKKHVSLEPSSASDTETVKKLTAIQPWNAFMAMIRSEMQGASDEKPKQDDVLAMAKSSKDSDPEAYKLFCMNWMANQTNQSTSN